MKNISRLMVFIWFSLFMAMSAPAEAADIASFPGGTSVHVARDSPTRAVFPVELTGSAKAKDLTVRRVSVRQNDVPADDLFDAVSVRFRPGLPAVVITIDDPAPEAGEYVITALLVKGSRRQVMTFTLVRDSADVRVPASASVTHRPGWAFVPWSDEADGSGGEGDDVDPSVSIRIGPHDAATASDLSVVETDTVKGTVCGSLIDDKDDDDLISLGLEPHGVALGESEHVCEITSPLLAQPTQVVVSVSNTRSLAWIFWLVVLGVAAGYGVRTFLTPRLTKLAAELGLARIRASIARTIESLDTNDPRLPGLRAALARTDAVPDGADVARINKARDDAAAAYEAAMQSAPVGRAAVATAGPAAQAQRHVRALERRSFLLGVARAVLLTLVLVLTAFGLFADTWIGTWQQMVAVLSWAFALDVTTSAVQQEIVKANPSTP